MRCDRRRETALRRHGSEEWPQVGHEAIVARGELVELAAGGDVLVLEAVRLPRRRRPERAGDDLGVDRGERVPGTRKETRHGREALLDRCCTRRAEPKRRLAASDP